MKINSVVLASSALLSTLLVGCVPGNSNVSSSSATSIVVSSSSSSSVVSSSSASSVAAVFELTSNSLKDGDPLPPQHGCEGKGFGEGYSPELLWTDGPTGTQSYAMLFLDTTLTDKGDANGYHWMMWNIPTSVNRLPENLSQANKPTEMQGATQYGAFGKGYAGPCPSWNGTRVTHKYAFILYAMPTATVPSQGTSVKNAQTYFEANKIGKTVFTVTSDAKPR